MHFHIVQKWQRVPITSKPSTFKGETEHYVVKLPKSAGTRVPDITLSKNSAGATHPWHWNLLYFWPRFHIVVLGMTFFFFFSHFTFSNFYLDFYFPFIFGLLAPFYIWTFRDISRHFETFRDISRHFEIFRSFFDLSNRGLILDFFQIFFNNKFGN